MPTNSRLSSVIARIFIVALVAAMVIAVVYFSVTSVPAKNPGLNVNLRYRQRPLAPRPAAATEFAEQCLVIGFIALAGRKVLRLRL